MLENEIRFCGGGALGLLLGKNERIFHALALSDVAHNRHEAAVFTLS
jgi:hypothetical protein